MPAWVHAQTSSAAAERQVRRRHPFWLLLRKEIHLQQLTVIIVAIYIVMWVAVWALGHQTPGRQPVLLQPLTMLYLGILSILIGSVASAEERQLGTLASQLLLPMAAWKQWTIKAGTALALAVLLSIAQPYALNAVIPPPDESIPLRLWGGRADDRHRRSRRLDSDCFRAQPRSRAAEDGDGDADAVRADSRRNRHDCSAAALRLRQPPQR
ncbi:MAG TPA: hypothetical protein VFT47_12620, partial [Vicinamibacterales bacterium]|nr:hypothetical protein [Vicinamibacterales bacterium]